MTNAEITSRVINIFKALSKDNRLSRRYVLKTLQNKAKFYISQKLSDKSLFREANLYTQVDCIEMKKIDVYKCDIIEFRSCKKLMRSVKQIPELVYSKYGSSVLEITSLDGEFKFLNITPAQYRLNKQRKKDNIEQHYFYIKDGYLYLPDSDIMSVSISILTIDLYEAQQCSECSKDKCKSVWDFEFVVPDKLLEVVISETIKEISLSRQIQEDQNPNLQDNA